MNVAFNPRIAELVKDLRTATRFNAYQFLHEAADLIEAFQREVVRISNSPAKSTPPVGEQPEAPSAPDKASGALIPCPALLGVPDGERGIPSSEALPAQKCSDTASVIAGQVLRASAGIVVTGNSERAVANSDEAITSAPMGLPLW